jgi:hypothetical protein
LARLKILGSKLKKSATRNEPPSVVLQAMQQQRQVAEGTTGGGAPSLAAPLDVSGHMPGTAVLSPSTAGAAGDHGWATVSSMQCVCVILRTVSACLAASVLTVLCHGAQPRPCLSAGLMRQQAPPLSHKPYGKGPAVQVWGSQLSSPCGFDPPPICRCVCLQV